MSTHTSEYRDAVEHLPRGGTLIFHNVDWQEYEQLLSDIEGRPGIRVSYDDGRLAVVSILPEHEEYKESLLIMVRAFAEAKEIELETRGSTTWKRRKFRKGSEADTCFYVANARRIIGKRTIDLETDPPPDVVVEVDTTRQSFSKFPIYSALRVGEVWCYDGKEITFYVLGDSSYRPSSQSPSFPSLTPKMITQFMEDVKSRGQTKALAAFRKRLR